MRRFCYTPAAVILLLLFRMKKTTVYIETLGCQMNVADTERAWTHLREAGYDPIDSVAVADVVILTPVRFASAPRIKFYQNRRVRKQRRGREPLIGMMGCVAQLEGEALFDYAPTLGFVAGTRATDRLPELIARAQAGESGSIDLGERRKANRGMSRTSSGIRRISPLCRL
jgi:tRNA-2-methylthio-N6-dimethylallyladenosine synthase